MTEYKLAVLGSPIGHSRSPQLQTALGELCGIKLEYDRIETRKGELFSTASGLVREGYHGFNCTMPLKAEAAMLADEISGEVRRLVSANTIKIERKRLIADTTDGAGMVLALEHRIGTIRGARALVLGAGGTARSIISALVGAGIGRVSVLSRRGEAPVDSPVVHPDRFENTPDCPALLREAESADIVINATPLGMSGFEEFAGFSFIDRTPAGAVIADAVYNPLETGLYKYALESGRAALDGLWLLAGQGLLSFSVWTGVRPDADIFEKLHERIKNIK